MRIRLADHDVDVVRCHAVMRELRPHLAEDAFVAQVARQRAAAGYRLAYVEDAAGRVVACAGFRIAEWLAWGKALYVDDLVTHDEARSQGYGGALFDWLVETARAESCAQLHLDSGVQRFDAHRFYLAKRMAITSHHFAMKL